MKKTVLVVEDDIDTSMIYSHALTEHGYEVLSARHGVEGVYLAQRHQPQLILMDIRMPVMNGWHALERLKNDSETRQIPVWVMSAHFDEDHSPQAPYARLLNKPIAPSDLVSQVQDFLGPI